MNLTKLKIGDLKIATYNPRKELNEKDKEYQKIKNSILEFGYVAPIIVNKDMTVISGHQRIKVLKDLSYEEIECIVVDFDKNKEKLLNIALNKISGEWDYQKLENIFNELENSNIDLSITGFDEKEINKLIKETPSYGKMVCKCEFVTEGEIIDSIKRPLGATTLDGIKRRTRAMMGGCQGTGCMIPISMILSKTLNIDISEVNKNSKSSTVVGFKED